MNKIAIVFLLFLFGRTGTEVVGHVNAVVILTEAVDKRQGFFVAVVARAEVTVVGGDDRVLLPLFYVIAIPLADTGAAGIGENDAAHGSELFK